MAQKLKILADQNIYKVSEFLNDHCKLDYFDPNQGFPDMVRDVDVLCVRTVSNVNADTLKQFGQLKAVGTASAGFDHIDSNFLQQKGIHFGKATACNARSVAEYVATAVLMIRENNQFESLDTIGIIGVGAVGSQVQQIFEGLGFTVLCYDPPRQKKDPNFNSCTFDSLLAESDIISVHTPLTTKGAYPSYHIINDDALSHSQAKIIINAARGGVVDEDALIHYKVAHPDCHLVLDVWENEPLFRADIFDECFLATPHIAGYSVEAKINATLFMLQELEAKSGLALVRKDYEVLSHQIIQKEKQQLQLDGNEPLAELLAKIHPAKMYMDKLKQIKKLDHKTKKKAFADLRVHTQLRNEYAQVQLGSVYSNHKKELKALGIRVE